MSADPIALMFGGMPKLAPGDDAETLKMLRSLPYQNFHLVVDAGCGSGRQTLVLARALNVPIHAFDTCELFLTELKRRSEAASLGHLVRTYCADMRTIPERFQNIDMLWSEGAAYSIGFEHALTSWATAIKPGGFVVVSELSWLSDRPPAPIEDFFRSEYPEMKSVDDNVALAERAGYRVLETRTLPSSAWTEGFYNVLKPRVGTLLAHSDAAVRVYARNMATEIDMFERSENSYGYTFYALQAIAK